MPTFCGVMFLAKYFWLCQGEKLWFRHEQAGHVTLFYCSLLGYRQCLNTPDSMLELEMKKNITKIRLCLYDRALPLKKIAYTCVYLFWRVYKDWRVCSTCHIDQTYEPNLTLMAIQKVLTHTFCGIWHKTQAFERDFIFSKIWQRKPFSSLPLSQKQDHKKIIVLPMLLNQYISTR